MRIPDFFLDLRIAIFGRGSMGAAILMSCTLEAFWTWASVGSNRVLRAADGSKSKSIHPPPGMTWIPGGVFTMGTDDVHKFPNECPAHKVNVGAFWIDEHDVTNVEFAKLVEAVGYVKRQESPITLA